MGQSWARSTLILHSSLSCILLLSSLAAAIQTFCLDRQQYKLLATHPVFAFILPYIFIALLSCTGCVWVLHMTICSTGSTSKVITLPGGSLKLHSASHGSVPLFAIFLRQCLLMACMLASILLVGSYLHNSFLQNTVHPIACMTHLCASPAHVTRNIDDCCVLLVSISCPDA